LAPKHAVYEGKERVKKEREERGRRRDRERQRKRKGEVCVCYRRGSKRNMAKYSTGAVIAFTITLHCDYMCV